MITVPLSVKQCRRQNTYTEGSVLVLITESHIDVDAGNDGKHEPTRRNKIAGSNIIQRKVDNAIAQTNSINNKARKLGRPPRRTVL